MVPQFPEMNVCLIQTDPSARQGNLQFLGTVIQNTKADLFLVPELFTNGFDYLARNFPANAEPIPDGPTCLQIRCFLQNRSSVVVCGLLEQSGADFYNIAAVMGHSWMDRYRQKHPVTATTAQGRVLRIQAGDYRKIPLPTLPPWSMGLMICNDYGRADEFFKEYKERTVNAVVLIADSSTRAWIATFPDLCRRYQLSAIVCNAAGPKCGGGGSCIINPAGVFIRLRVLQTQVEYDQLPDTAVAALGVI